MLDFVLTLVLSPLLAWLYLAGVTTVNARHKIGCAFVAIVFVAQGYRAWDLQVQNAAQAEAHTVELKKIRETHGHELQKLREDMQHNHDLQMEGIRKLSGEPGREVKATPSDQKPVEPRPIETV